MKISSEVLQAVRSRYNFLPPLVIDITCKNAHKISDIFKMLDNLPDTPFFWDDTAHEWRPAFGPFEAHEELDFKT